MEKIVQVGGKELKLKTSAAIPRIYRLVYGRDIFQDFSLLFEGIKNKDNLKAYELPPDVFTIAENILHLMNRYADDTQPDSVEDWLDQFETLDIIPLIPEIVTMWNIENTTTSKAKKNTEKQPGK